LLHTPCAPSGFPPPFPFTTDTVLETHLFAGSCCCLSFGDVATTATLSPAPVLIKIIGIEWVFWIFLIVVFNNPQLFPNSTFETKNVWELSESCLQTSFEKLVAFAFIAFSNSFNWVVALFFASLNTFLNLNFSQYGNNFSESKSFNNVATQSESSDASFPSNSEFNLSSNSSPIFNAFCASDPVKHTILRTPLKYLLH